MPQGTLKGKCYFFMFYMPTPCEIKFNINLDLQRFLGPLRRPNSIIEICQLICNQVERLFKEGKVGSRIATCSIHSQTIVNACKRLLLTFSSRLTALFRVASVCRAADAIQNNKKWPLSALHITLHHYNMHATRTPLLYH